MIMNTKLGIAAVLAFTFLITESCGIKKMVKNAKDISYETTPNPLELHGDSVKITVNGNFPEKYFHKKATVLVTPVVKFNGGEKLLKNITLKGDKIEGSGQSISYTAGGKFTVKDQFLYQAGMEKSDIILRATIIYKGKNTELPELKIADGTIVTPLLLQPDYKAIAVGDKFDKNPTVTQKSNIYFLVDSWEVRNIELNSDEMSNLYRFIDKGAKDSSEFTSLDIYGFASPEGELTRNSKLSENRADEAFKVMQNRFNKAKMKDLAKREGFYKKTTTNFEDWDGLKGMLQSSSVEGKDQAINIINTIGDPEAREAEFRKMASFDPIYEAYFPKLRRAEINLVAKLKTRTDAQISALAASAPDSLGYEELMYAAGLTTELNQKMAIYNAFARRFPEDYRGFNNMGYIYVLQGKVNEAQAEFEKANRISANNPVIQNNLGAVAAMKGDKKGAATLFNNAGAAPEVSYNKGNLAVANGKYSEASAAYGSTCSFNAALAKLLAGNPSGANQTLDCSTEKETAAASYLKAVIAARNSDKEGVVSNLTKAISADKKWKEKAKTDLEFRKFTTELGSILN